MALACAKASTASRVATRQAIPALLSQEFAARRFVGIGLVDGEQEIGAIGELAGDAVFGRMAAPQALHDQVVPREGVQREIVNVAPVPPTGT